MAHGISSLSILYGMSSPDGHLTSMDPWQHSHWQGCGRQLLIDEGFAAQHTLIEAVDWFGLPELLKNGSRFDFAYIDGDHSFACTFLDFFYLDKMLDVGGIVGFNDCGMPAVQRVVSYLRANLDYEPVDEVRISWWQRRRLKFWEYPDLYFRKRTDLTVPWNEYFNF